MKGWLCVSLVALAGCTHFDSEPSENADAVQDNKSVRPQRQLQQRFGGDRVSLISNAVRVEAYRVEETTSASRTADANVLSGDYRVLDHEPHVPRELLTKLVDILSDDRSFDWEGDAKLCIPVPGIVFVFYDGDQSVAVHVCFACQDLSIGRRMRDWHDERWIDFTPKHDELLRIARRLFPDDAELNELRTIEERETQDAR